MQIPNAQAGLAERGVNADLSSIGDVISGFEKLRGSSCLVLCSKAEGGKNLEPKDVVILYEFLRRIGKVRSLDLVLNTPGGGVCSAYRIARMIREYAERFTIFLPYQARSSGTLLCLGADEIVMNALSELSPLDAFIRAGANAGPSRISTEEIRSFRQVAAEWFGMKAKRFDKELLEMVTQRIFPSTLVSFYRADRYLRKAGLDLLRYNAPRSNLKQRRNIMDTLVSGYLEHGHGITQGEAKKLGLTVREFSAEEDAMVWELFQKCQKRINGPISSVATNEPVSALLLSSNYAAQYLPRIHIPTTALAKNTSGEYSTVSEVLDRGRWEVLGKYRE